MTDHKHKRKRDDGDDITLFDLLWSNYDIEKRIVAALEERKLQRIRNGTFRRFAPVTNQFKSLRDHYYYVRRRGNWKYKFTECRDAMFTTGGGSYRRWRDDQDWLISIDNSNECSKRKLWELIEANVEGRGVKMPKKSAKKEALIKFLWHELDIVSWKQ